MKFFCVLVLVVASNILKINTVYVPSGSSSTPRPYTSSLKLPNSKPLPSQPLYHSSYSKVYVHNQKNYTSSLNSLNSQDKKVYPVYSGSEKQQKLSKKIEDLLDEHNSNIVEKDSLNNRVVYKRRIEKSKQIPVFHTCPKDESGQFVYDLSCNQYLDCWKGRGGPRNCAPGTLFNPKTLECDFPEKVECLTGPGRTANIIQQRSAKIEAFEQADCPEGFSGLIPNYTDCSKFIQCNNGRPFSQICPPGTLFDTTLNICNFPDKCTCFSGQGTYLYHKETPQKQSISDNQLGYGWSQEYNHNQPYGSQSTNHEVQTSWNIPTGNQGLQYTQYVSCDPNRYNCSQYHESKTVTTGCNPLTHDCGQATGQQIQNYKQSTTYSGYPTKQTTPTKNYNTICNINDRNCYGGSTNTHQSYHSGKSYESQSRGSQGGTPKCPQGFQGITKHPTNCKKFLNCANGITYIQDCAPGTLFNPLNNICDFPYNVKCDQSGGDEEGSDLDGGNDNYIPPEFHRTEPQGGDRQGKCQGTYCQGQWNQGLPNQGGTYNTNQEQTGYQWNQGGEYSTHQGQPHTGYQGHTQTQYPSPGQEGHFSGQNTQYYQPGFTTTQQGSYNQGLCQPGQKGCQNVPSQPSSIGNTQYYQPGYDKTNQQVLCQPWQHGCQNVPAQPSSTGHTQYYQPGYGTTTQQVLCQPGQHGCQNVPSQPSSPGNTQYYQPGYGTTTQQGSYNQVSCQPGQPGCQNVPSQPIPPGQTQYYQPGYSSTPQQSGSHQAAGYYSHTNCQPGQVNCPPVVDRVEDTGSKCPPGYSCQPTYQPTQGQGGYQINGTGYGRPSSGGYNITQVGVVPCHPSQQGCIPVQPSSKGQSVKKVYVVEETQTPEGGFGNVYPVYQVEENSHNPPQTPQIGGSASYVPPSGGTGSQPTYITRPLPEGQNPPGTRTPNATPQQARGRDSPSRSYQPPSQGGYQVPVEVKGYKGVEPINKDDERTYQGYSSQRLPDYVDVFDPSETKANSLASTKRPKMQKNLEIDQQVAYSFPEYVFEYEDGEQVTLAPENIVLLEKKLKTKCEKGDFKCDQNKCIEKIFVCDGEKDCLDGRDEKKCEDYVNQFDLHENSRLDVLEKQRYDNVTQFTCALLCIQNRQFECKSFNYRKIDKACFLTDENIDQSGALQIYYPCDYYEKKSTKMDCSSMHKCSNGKCLTSEQVCDGFNDCGNREDEKNCRPDDFGYEVKLAGSNSGHEGRVEITVFNQTGYICDDQFSITDANVLCKELGFALGAAEVRGNSHFAKGIKENHTLYMMDDIECFGNETSLMDCNFAGWGIHNCGDFEIAGVVCKTPEETCGDGFWKCDIGNECVRVQFVCDGIYDCTDNSDESSSHCDAPTAVRLVNGTTEKEGRLEVSHHGIWGTVCDDDFNEDAAKIVCKYLGFKGSALVQKEAFYGSGPGPIWLDQVSCLGNETTLEQCTHWEWGEHNCDHSEDVGIVCGGKEAEVESAPNARSSKVNKDQYVAAESSIGPNYNEVEPTQCGYRKDNIFLQSDDVHFRVVQGSVAKPGDYPWQAALKVKAHDKTAHWCGAVVISSKWILTAAHCLEGYPKGAYVLVAGEYNIDENEGTEQQAFIEEYYVHEQFRQGHKMGNDIALIKLKGSGFKLNQDIQPICLPDESADYESEDLNCTISGFGTIQTGKSAYSHTLRAAWIPIQKLDICRMAHVYGEQIGDGMICAGDLEGGVDACDGDSGGPLACLDNGVFTLFGVTSWGQRCGYANKPGVYVKVSHYKKWIDNIIKTHS